MRFTTPSLTIGKDGGVKAIHRRLHARRDFVLVQVPSGLAGAQHGICGWVAGEQVSVWFILWEGQKKKKKA